MTIDSSAERNHPRRFHHPAMNRRVGPIDSRASAEPGAEDENQDADQDREEQEDPELEKHQGVNLLGVRSMPAPGTEGNPT